MPIEALEDLRLLSNLETDKEKLLQMVIVGQPELLTTISKPELRQLHQRVAISCTLDYLKKEEVSGYIERRLFVAGNKGQVRFTRASVDRIFKASSGTPRLINRICDYSLIAGYLANDHTIHKRYVIQTLRELGSPDPAAIKFSAGKPFHRAVSAFLLMALAVFIFYLGSWVSRNREGPAVAPAVKDMNAQPESQPNSFTVLIASHKLADNVLQEASRYRANGVDSHWVKVDLGKDGIWYRHFAGRFIGRAEALRFIRESGLAGARILAAPWAISMGEGMSPEVIGSIADMLRSNRYDAYAQEMKNGGYRLLIGAFVSREGAENAAREITLPGIVPEIVLR
jgi:hypothetical protein